MVKPQKAKAKNDVEERRMELLKLTAGRSTKDCFKYALRFAAIFSTAMLLLYIFQSRIENTAHGILLFVSDFIVVTPVWFLFQLVQRRVAQRKLAAK